IFQRTMEGLLQGILQVAVYLDDILVTGLTEVEHLENLEEILNRLEKAGLCLKRSKCTFKAKEVVFLGHKVDATGLHPVKEEVQAIQEAPATKLKSYLGLLNDYNRFLPNLSALLMPLQLPLQKYVKWYWGCVQEKAFEASKILECRNFITTYTEHASPDHKPLISLSNEMKAVPQMASPRIQRW
uniref:ribonuclease H n=1 Tax=Latimeria chalumnae TaxID=7897 RepID=H3B9C3_LATCH